MIIALLLVTAMSLAYNVSAQSGRAAPAELGIRDCGQNTRGGIDGQVIKVKNLDREGEGSLRAALEAEGPRLIVFEVGGVIDLEKGQLQIDNPFVTLAGQTAPDPGITIIKGGISITTHDVRIEHISVRPGDAGQPKKSGWEPDGITTSGGQAYNIVIDHCSVTWAVDENISVSGPRTLGPDATSHKVTISNCIIAEGLHESSHAKGPHSKGSLIHDYCRDIAIVRNFYAHNAARNPYFKAFTTGAVINNIIYNPTFGAVMIHFVESEWKDSNIKPDRGIVAIVGNVLRHGEDSSDELSLAGWKGEAYLEENMVWGKDGQPARLAHPDLKRVENAIWPEGYTKILPDRVELAVLMLVGARPWARDPIDRRIVDAYMKREGRVIDSQEEVGGYPSYEMTRRELEVPVEDIDAWLGRFGK
jgi:hypothetical protein